MQELQAELGNYRQFQSTAGWSPIINIDGLIAYDVGHGPGAAGYVFAFRNGIIESVVDDIYHTRYPQELSAALGNRSLARVRP